MAPNTGLMPRVRRGSAGWGERAQLLPLLYPLSCGPRAVMGGYGAALGLAGRHTGR